jgi:hypothetical protein
MTTISTLNNNTVGPTGTYNTSVVFNEFINTTGITGGTGANINKWTRDQEELLAKWADKALCYRWLHDLSERKYNNLNNKIQIPVIILSTVTGAINVGINSIFPQNFVAYGSFGLGAISISTGILTTIGNFLRFAQNMEGHRVASLQWSKFHRSISAELAIHPDRRTDSIEFFTIKRAELDRLVESAPMIPTDIIEKFENRFRDTLIEKPEICDYLEPTYIYEAGKRKPKIINKRKTLTQKIFSAFSSSKNKDTNQYEDRSNHGRHGHHGHHKEDSGSGNGSGSGNTLHNSADINTDDESIITFNNDSNKVSPNGKKMNSPITFADAAHAAHAAHVAQFAHPNQVDISFTNKKQDDNVDVDVDIDIDVENGLKRILEDKKKSDSELSNKLHVSILESLNR